MLYCDKVKHRAAAGFGAEPHKELNAGWVLLSSGA